MLVFGRNNWALDKQNVTSAEIDFYIFNKPFGKCLNQGSMYIQLCVFVCAWKAELQFKSILGFKNLQDVLKGQDFLFSNKTFILAVVKDVLKRLFLSNITV